MTTRYCTSTVILSFLRRSISSGFGDGEIHYFVFMNGEVQADCFVFVLFSCFSFVAV